MQRTRLGRRICQIEGAEGFHPVECDAPLFGKSPSQRTGSEKSEAVTLEALQLVTSFQADLVEVWTDVLSTEALAKEVLILKDRVDQLERVGCGTMCIHSLAPEPHILKQPIPASVRLSDDAYIASFYDANLAASGDTPEEAVMNLKDVIIAAYETLSELKQEQLDPGPSRQLAVLKEFIATRR